MKRNIKPVPLERQQELDQAIRNIALTIDSKARIAKVAEAIGVSAESIRKSIRNGYFSKGMAAQLELQFGPQIVSNAMLTRKVTND